MARNLECLGVHMVLVLAERMWPLANFGLYHCFTYMLNAGSHIVPHFVCFSRLVEALRNYCFLCFLAHLSRRLTGELIG